MAGAAPQPIFPLGAPLAHSRYATRVPVSLWYSKMPALALRLSFKLQLRESGPANSEPASGGNGYAA